MRRYRRFYRELRLTAAILLRKAVISADTRQKNTPVYFLVLMQKETNPIRKADFRRKKTKDVGMFYLVQKGSYHTPTSSHHKSQ